jgi:hypothetical protein
MKLKTLVTLALISGAMLSCSESVVVPAPCPADGRMIQVFFSSAGGESMSDTGSFVGWNEYWVTLELDSGRLIHHSTNSVSSIHEVGK